MLTSCRLLRSYLTGHGPLQNHADEPRYMVYFRVTHSGVETPHYGTGRGADALCDPWLNWPGLRGAVLEEQAAGASSASAKL